MPTPGDDTLLPPDLDAANGATRATNADRGAGIGTVFNSELVDATQLTPTIEQFGSYRILSVLGRGGMGLVYRAEQSNPRRQVALKVIGVNYLSHELMKRFDREASLLGRLKHPGIAQIYEAGVSDSAQGRQPFFAMELVEGLPLDDFAKRNALPTRDRLSLLIKICDAVQYAHQHAIIHRDLKPGNILVTADGQPKILDFGVARATDSDVQTLTMQTDVGQVVGTLPYMSPEQAIGATDDVDTRTDVYSLGVIAYELLSGRLPLNLSQRPIHEAVRIIREEEPSRLSAIDRAFRGDVETIVGKAMEKEKSRRYAGAAELAADLGRYLRNEMIVARPASTWYQVSKFARRNRILVGGIAAVIIVLTLGIFATSIALVGQARQRKLAQANEAKARAEATRADDEAKASARSLRITQAASSFLQTILGAADPTTMTKQDQARGHDVTVMQALDEAAKQVDGGSLRDTPDVELIVHRAIGQAYNGLGNYAAADHHAQAELALARRLFEPGSPEIGTAMENLAIAYSSEQRPDEAEKLMRDALALNRANDGTLSVAYANDLANLSTYASEREDFANAEALAVEALAIRRALQPRNDGQIEMSLEVLSSIYGKQQKFAQSEAVSREAIQMARSYFGAEHPNVARAMNNLSNALQFQGKFDEAAELQLASADMRRKLYGPDHTELANSLNNLATLRLAQGRAADGEQPIREALAIWRKTYESDHPLVMTAVNNLARILYEQKKYDEAETLQRELVAWREKTEAADDWRLTSARGLLGQMLLGQNRYAEAEPLLVACATTLPHVSAPNLGMKRKRESLRAVVELYDRLSNAEQADRWRRELQAFDAALQPTSKP